MISDMKFLLCSPLVMETSSMRFPSRTFCLSSLKKNNTLTLRGLSWRVQERVLVEVTLDRKLVEILKGSRVMAAGLPQSLGSVHLHMQVHFADWKSDGQLERQTSCSSKAECGTDHSHAIMRSRKGVSWVEEVRPRYVPLCNRLRVHAGLGWFLPLAWALSPSAEISIAKILPPRPIHMDCWPAHCFIDAHGLTGYFLVLQTRKSSGPFLPLDVDIIIWCSQGNLFPSGSQGLPPK